MSSGVTANSDCIETYGEMQMKKAYKYITFVLSDNKKEIVVSEKVARKPDVSNEEAFTEFTKKLTTDCLYAVFDFEYEKTDATSGITEKRNRICFIFWAPDNSQIRQKMIYASSKDSLRKSLPGIQIDLQATDESEVDYAVVLEKCDRFRR